MREKELFSVSFESVSSMRRRGVFADPYCLLKFLRFMHSGNRRVLGSSEYILGVVIAMLDAGIEVNLWESSESRLMNALLLSRFGHIPYKTKTEPCVMNALLLSCDGEVFDVSLTRLLLSRGGICGLAVGHGYEGRLLEGCADKPDVSAELSLVDRLRVGETDVMWELECIHIRDIVYLSSRIHRFCVSDGLKVSLASLIESGLSSLGEILLSYAPGLESYARYVRSRLLNVISDSRWLLSEESRKRSVGNVLFGEFDRYVYCANAAVPALWVRRRNDGRYELRTCGGELEYGGMSRVLNAFRDRKRIFYDRVDWADTECGRMVIRCYVGDECCEITLLEGRRESKEVESYWCGIGSCLSRDFPASREYRVRYAGSFGESIESMESRGVRANPLCMLDYFRMLKNHRFDMGVGVAYLLSVIDYFVSKGIDVNAVDGEGDTALSWVLELGRQNAFCGRRYSLPDAEVSLLVGKLLSCGAVIGDRTLQKCCREGLLCVIRVLLEYGAELSFRDLPLFFGYGSSHEWKLCNCIEMLKLYYACGLSLSSSELMQLLRQVSNYADEDGRYVGDFSVEFLSRQRELIISILSCCEVASPSPCHAELDSASPNAVFPSLMIDWCALDFSGHSLLDGVRETGNESLYKWLSVILESSYKRYAQTKPSYYSLLLVSVVGSSVPRSHVTAGCLPVDRDSRLNKSSFASDAWISLRSSLGIGEDELVYISPFMFGELLCEFVDAELCRLLELPFGSEFVMNGIRIEITPVESGCYDYTYRVLPSSSSSVTCTSVPSTSALRVDFLRLCTSSFLSHISTYPFEVA
jgi:hypothetical protein